MPAKKTAAKNSKKSANTSLIRRVHQKVTANFEASIAMVSIFVNIFFLTGLVLYHTSPGFEQKVFQYTHDNFCSVRKDGVTIQAYELTCRRGKFTPYYEKAVESYLQAPQSVSK